MKIGLLNLPLDNNYGGNLQRYALMKVLQDMGHEVEHIMLLRRFLPSKSITIKVLMVQLLQRLLHNTPIYIWSRINEHQQYYRGVRAISQFYNRYIPHTKPVYSSSEIDYSKYDVLIVGSDQVWRKSMVPYFGLDNFFLGFVSDEIIKIGYGICIGNYEEWTDEDKQVLRPLYKRLNALSVRESQSIDFLNDNGFDEPKAQWVLDPTLLLDRDSYDTLIHNSNTRNLTGGMLFAYILDITEQTIKDVEEIANYRKIGYYLQTLTENSSIEQWIRNIKDSECVVTDSYHGVVFSIIYKKPFRFISNERRGNVRLISLLKMLDVDSEKTMNINYDIVQQIVVSRRLLSISFIKNSLSFS